MKQYIDLLQRILNDGEERGDRTGTGTLSVFGGQMEFDLRDRFPLVTIKETRWKSAFIEMLWFLRGESHIKYLHEHNVRIWDQWANETGDLGPVYGVQWRHWECADGMGHPYSIDQIKNLVNRIKSHPECRRHIVTAWNPGDVPRQALPPCHYLFQCYVSKRKTLDLKVHIRSWDTVLGAPFNIAQYALLTHLLCRATNLTPGRLIVDYGDAHIYMNHVEKVRQMLDKENIRHCSTQLIMNPDKTDIDSWEPNDFAICNYLSNRFISFPVAV